MRIQKYENIKTVLNHIVRNFDIYLIKNIAFRKDKDDSGEKDSTCVYIQGVTFYDPIIDKKIQIMCNADTPLSFFTVTVTKPTDNINTSFSVNISALVESEERTSIIEIVRLLNNKSILIK